MKRNMKQEMRRMLSAILAAATACSILPSSAVFAVDLDAAPAAVQEVTQSESPANKAAAIPANTYQTTTAPVTTGITTTTAFTGTTTTTTTAFTGTTVVTGFTETTTTTTSAAEKKDIGYPADYNDDDYEYFEDERWGYYVNKKENYIVITSLGSLRSDYSYIEIPEAINFRPVRAVDLYYYNITRDFEDVHNKTLYLPKSVEYFRMYNLDGNTWDTVREQFPNLRFDDYITKVNIPNPNCVLDLTNALDMIADANESGEDSFLTICANSYGKPWKYWDEMTAEGSKYSGCLHIDELMQTETTPESTTVTTTTTDPRDVDVQITLYEDYEMTLPVTYAPKEENGQIVYDKNTRITVTIDNEDVAKVDNIEYLDSVMNIHIAPVSPGYFTITIRTWADSHPEDVFEAVLKGKVSVKPETTTSSTGSTKSTEENYTTTLIIRTTAPGTGDDTHNTYYADNLLLEMPGEERIQVTYPPEYDDEGNFIGLKTDLRYTATVTRGEDILKLSYLSADEQYVYAAVEPLATGFAEIKIRLFSDDGQYDLVRVFSFNVIPRQNQVTEPTYTTTATPTATNHGTTTTTTTLATTLTTETTTNLTSASTTARTEASETPGKQILGDLNCDGVINIKDGVLLARLVGEDDTLELLESGMANADVNQDGTWTASDVVKLLRMIANLEDK